MAVKIKILVFPYSIVFFHYLCHPKFEYDAKNKDALTCKENIQGYRYGQDPQV